MFDIGRVFSTSFAMLRERLWPLAGMWAVFLAIQMAAYTVLSVVIAVVGIAGIAGLGFAIDDPASASALSGIGIGVFVMMALFFAAYLMLAFAQQAAMVTLASPLERAAFGDAMLRGFRTCLPFLAISVLLTIGYIAFTLVIMAIMSALALTGSAGAGVFGGLVGLASLPLMLFLACRFAVLVPVVAVDQVFSPIAALRRSWSVTRGKALRIFLALLGFFGIAMVAVLLPFALIFVAADMAQDNTGLGLLLMGLGFLVFVPVGIGFMLYTATFTAALHCEVTGGGAERLEEVFA
ncbi:hypothetical protein [Erythrobacter sp. BLCC-B19]|uniref:hypothetical protein n=1 Tax=Erythrobacter sp. BLCC-B19 TaxID=3025315 RepID=UPI00236293F2|nr:hypothetical protein [Erythrobacter sp. BLCC-B19]WDA41200.1 hypothetical protein PS060_16890 [Erythrobacter sp. BLCC-B19]